MTRDEFALYLGFCLFAWMVLSKPIREVITILMVLGCLLVWLGLCIIADTAERVAGWFEAGAEFFQRRYDAGRGRA